KQQTIDRYRHEEEGHLNDPVHFDEVAAHKTNYAAGDEPSRPAGVQDVQVMGFLVRIKGGHHRVDHNFAGAVGDGKHDHAHGQTGVYPIPAKGVEDWVDEQC